MIYNAQSIKNRIKKMCNGDNKKSYLFLRIFFMENFIKRISFSKYKDNIVIKGGILVTQELGISSRVTKDIEATIKNYNLTIEDVELLIMELVNMSIDDGINYYVESIDRIMDEHDYPGIRVSMIGTLGETKQSFKIDFSTGDIITPSEIEYRFNCSFDDRPIVIKAYNVETLLAEKIETILDRNITNTRMRDFYDIHMFFSLKKDRIDFMKLKAALKATSKNRNTIQIIDNAKEYIDLIANDEYLKLHWNNYKNDNGYVGNVEYGDTILSLIELLKEVGVLR